MRTVVARASSYDAKKPHDVERHTDISRLLWRASKPNYAGLSWNLAINACRVRNASLVLIGHSVLEVDFLAFFITDDGATLKLSFESCKDTRLTFSPHSLTETSPTVVVCEFVKTVEVLCDRA